jgi:methylamine dehydrogenase accessory protein MauD
LLLFAVAMAVNLALGRQPECRCFGELTSSKISTVSVVRNLVLAVVAMALASGALGHPDSNIFDWVGGLSAAEAGLFGLGLAVVLLGWVSVNLFLQHGRLLNRMRAVEDALRGVGLLVGSHEGLAVGTSAPDIQLSTIDGRLRKLGDYLADGRPALLVFVSSGCLPCAELLPRLGEWQRGVGADSVVIVANGTPEDYRDVAAEHGLQNVLLDEDDTVSQLFDVRGTPAAVLVDADMRIATPIAGGSDQVEALWLKLGAAEPGYSVLKQP